METNFVVAIIPFVVMFIFYLIFVAIGFLILYLVIRAGINNSKLNQNIESLRVEITRMNHYLQSSSSNSERV